ncbi:hypothetical protein [uncultured Frigoribacterium sp.]|uniref:WXG100 family type VII secretion target n=1 Tax=Frigoribacterium sp. VKM Ac-2530 TaxID=2783822 RepID=UPI0028D69FA4|nr:hypothetical protein [uncultured Frigoribacterium sp.]
MVSSYVDHQFETHEETMMKFAMGSETLTQLSQKTSGAGDDLGALVRQLADAAEPLEGRFNGAGRAAFDRFKNEVDGISVELNAALSSVLTGITGQNRAFLEGEQQIADETSSAQAGAGFESARFGTQA